MKIPWSWSSINFRVTWWSLVTTLWTLARFLSFKQLITMVLLGSSSKASRPSLNLLKNSELQLWNIFMSTNSFKHFMRCETVLMHWSVTYVCFMTIEKTTAYLQGCYGWTDWTRTFFSLIGVNHNGTNRKWLQLVYVPNITCTVALVLELYWHHILILT